MKKQYMTMLAVATAVVALPASTLAVELYTGGKSEADIRADSVVRCHNESGEFGAEAIEICVQAESAARAALAQYPDEVSDIVIRCNTQLYMAGWTRIKYCADNDIRARESLSAYPQQQADLIAQCRKDVGGDGDARVKQCVDERSSQPGKNEPKPK
jgi:hypothetical protein